jgi:GT2 family glycosyltransferase
MTWKKPLRLPLRRRLSAAVLVALVAFPVAWAVGMFDLDPRIANSWGGYHYGNLENRIRQINLPLQTGVAMVVESARDRRLVPLESHSDNWYFDDIGYIFFGQVASRLLGPLTADGIVRFHNTLFVVGLVTTAAAFAFVVGHAWAGAVLFVPFVGIHALFEPHSYNSASHHSLIVPMTAAFLPWLFVLGGLLRAPLTRAGHIASGVPLAAAGAVAGAMALVRHPVGAGAFLALAVLTVLTPRTWRRRGAALAACLVGYLVVVHVLPGIAAWERDRSLGWGESSWLYYFQGPPKHAPYFTVLASVGRYPNGLGLVIVDRAVDDLLVARKTAEPRRWRGEYHEVFDRIARDVLLEYVVSNPSEFLSHRLRGILELFAVVPGVTFQVENNFAGSPWTTPAIDPIVDPADRRPMEPRQLINVRVAYVDVGPLTWALYLGAIAAVLGAAVLTWRLWSADESGVSRVFVAVLTLTGLYAAARGLIPWWGQDFAFMFWVSAALASSMLVFRAAELLRAKRRDRKRLQARAAEEAGGRDKPALSVVLGSYNRRAYLKRAIESVRRSGIEVPWEIVVVDGGSDDGSLQWLLAQKDVLTIVQHNRGVFRGRVVPRRSWGYFMNLAFRAARGELIVMISDDCLLHPGAINAALRTFRHLSAEGRQIGGIAFYFRNWPEERDYFVQLTIGGKLMVNHGLFVRSAIEAVGWIEEDLYRFYKADSDLCLKLWQGGYEIVDCPESFVEHHGGANLGVRQSNDALLARDRGAYLERWRGTYYDPEKPELPRRVTVERGPAETLRLRFPREPAWVLSWRRAYYRVLTGLQGAW